MVFIKKTTIILFLLLLLVIAGGSVDIPDYDAYEAMYVHDIEYPNRLYGYISDWFAYSGFDFNVFRLVWGVTALVGIFYPVRQLLNEKQQIIFIVLFMVSQFWVEIMQVRNFMVVSLFSISFYILLKQKIYSSICYLLMMLCASQIHQIAYAFLPVVLGPYCIKYRFLRRLFIFFILSIMVVCIFEKNIILSLMTIIPDGILFNKLVVYLIKEKTSYNYICSFSLHICLIVILLIFYKIATQNKINIWCKKINFYKFLQCVLWLNVYLMISWPVMKIDLNFFRFIRVVTPINLITIILSIKFLYTYAIPCQRIMIMYCISLYVILYFVICILYGFPVVEVISSYSNWMLKLIC